MSLTRHFPPIVAQTLQDSCWAAALESWSRVDRRMARLSQSALVQRWGEGAAGGITPATKIPPISDAYGLAWGGFRGADLEAYVRRNLPSSHIFCAYTRGLFTHAVLIYRLSPRGNLSYMDPDGGHDRWLPLASFRQRGDFVLMRRR